MRGAGASDWAEESPLTLSDDRKCGTGEKRPLVEMESKGCCELARAAPMCEETGQSELAAQVMGGRR